MTRAGPLLRTNPGVGYQLVDERPTQACQGQQAVVGATSATAASCPAAGGATRPIGRTADEGGGTAEPPGGGAATAGAEWVTCR